MNIIGQDNLIKIFDDMTSLPHAFMLKGPKGCGKHLLVSYLAEKWNMDVIDITENLNFDMIERINEYLVPTIYTIDTTSITEKEQNIILKFLEEPVVNAYIVLLCPNFNYILETIQNRCIVYSFESYTKSILSQFLDGNQDKLIIELSDTPGDVINYKAVNVNEIYDFACKVVDKIRISNVSNALFGIMNKVAFKEDQTKYNLDILVKALLIASYKKYSDNPDINIEYYKLTNKLWNDLQIPNINKEYLFENYLLDMKEVK